MIQALADPLIPLEPGDEKLLTLAELANALRRRNIIDRGESTLRNWCIRGVQAGGHCVKLETVKIANVRHSSVRLVVQFLADQQ